VRHSNPSPVFHPLLIEFSCLEYISPVLANAVTESSHCFCKCYRNPGCPDFV
jgi:hypothetical protein